MKKIYLILFIGLSFLLSCQKHNLPDVGGTSAQNMANEWWVTYTVNGVDILGIGHIKIATYNSSANTNELWIDDLGNGASGANFKVKATADFNNMTFSATNANNEDYTSGSSEPQAITISNGKVLLGQAHSRTGNVTDSIYMQVAMGGTTYVVSGYARTRWPEDDY